MFGSLAACSLCWERDCNCTPQQIEEYEKRREVDRNKKTEIIYSTTEPKVIYGDIILDKYGDELLVREIIDGIPHCSFMGIREFGYWGDGVIRPVVGDYEKLVFNPTIQESPIFKGELSGIKLLGRTKVNQPLLEQFKALFSNMPCELRELKAKECVEVAERFAQNYGK